MKKITYVLALFLVAQTITFAQTAVSPEFEDWLIANGYDTIDDDFIDDDLDPMIVNETALYLGVSTISDFTGISVFVNLLDFDIEYNTTITSLNISTLTSLTRLDIEGCSSLTSITLPGAGSQLTDIQANDAALATIDVSNNTLLEILHVRANNLSDLDLSANGALTDVICRNQGSALSLTVLDMRNGNNANTALDADENNNLTCIYVDDLAEPNLLTWGLDLTAPTTLVLDEAGCLALGTDDRTTSVFSMYPNPTRNTVNVASKEQSSALLDVYSITGKKVLSKQLSFGDNSVNISSLSSGVYLAKFSADNRSETKKLIIN